MADMLTMFWKRSQGYRVGATPVLNIGIDADNDITDSAWW
jgi:hypothetical protein